MGARILLLATLVAALMTQRAAADDFGPRGSVSVVRGDVHRLLAYRVRTSGVDPKNLVISDVIVAGNEALASWDSGKSRGLMGLLYQDDRWWDLYDVMRMSKGDFWLAVAFPPFDAHPYVPITPKQSVLLSAGFDAALAAQANLHNADVRDADSLPRRMPRIDPGCVKCWTLDPQGGFLAIPRILTAAYQLTFHFSRNDAPKELPVTQVYVRAPTSAEFLPKPTPPKNAGGPTDVGFFDLDIGGAQPVTFVQGTIVDVWFPFVLDDTLRYEISLFTNEKASGPYSGTIFDNTVHFELPAFTIVPGKPLQAEISGWY